MEENVKNKIGLFIFIFVILFLLIGGFFFTKYVLNDKTTNNNKINKTKNNIKIDKKKDYIYYEETDEISSDMELNFKKITINIKNQEILTDSLNREATMYKDNIKYIDNNEIFTEDIIHYNNNNIYYMTFRDYKIYESSNYVSLVVNDYNYSCIDNVTFKESKTYTFDLSTGNLLKKEELANIFEKSDEMIKESVRAYLTKKSEEEVDKQAYYKIDETVNELNLNNIYVNEFGKLSISFLVKTTDVNYNDNKEV